MPFLAPFVPALIAGAATVGTAVYSAGQQKKAAQQGLEAQTQNNDRALAEQAAARNQSLQVNQPFLSGGAQGWDQLLSELGVKAQPAQGGQGSGAQGGYGTQGGGPDYQGYLNANGDLASSGWLDQHRGEWGDLTGDGQVNDLDTAAKHYELHGRGEGRPLPTVPAKTGNAGVSPLEGAEAPPAAPDLRNAPRPEAPQAPALSRPAAPIAPTFNRPTDPAAPSFARPTDPNAPTFERPNAPNAPQFSRPEQGQFNDSAPAPSWNQYFDPNNIQMDPGYQFRLEQGTKGVNSNFAARGLLRSGGALKGMADYQQGMASQEFGNIFNRAMQRYQTDLGQYNTGRSQSFNIFNTNRANTNQNFESDRAAGTDDYRFGVNRADTNFNTDRAAATSDYRYATDRGDKNYENDRDTARDDYRFDANRRDTNFNSDRSYGTNLWKEQQDRGDRNFDTDRGFSEDRYRYDTGRQDRNFETDRSYQTSRYDTRIGNLFDVADIGVRAAGQASSVAQNYANNAGNIYGSQANAAADAANSRAGANAGVAGAIGGAVGNVFNNYGSRGGLTPISAIPPVTSGRWTLPDYNTLSRPPSSVVF